MILQNMRKDVFMRIFSLKKTKKGHSSRLAQIGSMVLCMAVGLSWSSVSAVDRAEFIADVKKKLATDCNINNSTQKIENSTNQQVRDHLNSIDVGLLRPSDLHWVSDCLGSFTNSASLSQKQAIVLTELYQWVRHQYELIKWDCRVRTDSIKKAIASSNYNLLFMYMNEIIVNKENKMYTNKQKTSFFVDIVKGLTQKNNPPDNLDAFFTRAADILPDNGESKSFLWGQFGDIVLKSNHLGRVLEMFEKNPRTKHVMSMHDLTKEETLKDMKNSFPRFQKIFKFLQPNETVLLKLRKELEKILLKANLDAKKRGKHSLDGQNSVNQDSSPSLKKILKFIDIAMRKKKGNRMLRGNQESRVLDSGKERGDTPLVTECITTARRHSLCGMIQDLV